jgi:glutamate-1-semialdehyde 2,1-aminomutase
MSSRKSLKNITPAWNSAGFLRLPVNPKPVDSKRVEELLAQEWETYTRRTSKSAEHNRKVSEYLPLGVTSSFQHWDPHPITIVSGDGAYLTDVDGRAYLDLSMGFGAMLVGHLNPAVVEAMEDALKTTGTLFVTPALTSSEAAERFSKRFGLDMIRFTNSGTESTMYAIRVARVVTGKQGVAKVEGGFHGGYDPLQVSVKPPVKKIGRSSSPKPYIPDGVNGENVFVVAYNDLPGLEKLFKKHSRDIACFIVEPVIENLSIILPDEGYLEGVRALCDKYKVALIFDEVKTGLTAGVAGASARVGVQPDLVTLAKSIGGGMPIAAFGGKREFMEAVVDGRMPHYGTYNGNPISAAAMLAVDAIVSKETLTMAERINVNALTELSEIINEYQLPAHTVGFGVKGAVIWSPKRVRNYRDFKATDFQLAELSWLWNINRAIITPPGLDEQWLVSLATTQSDMDKMVESVRELAKALRAEPVS